MATKKRATGRAGKSSGNTAKTGKKPAASRKRGANSHLTGNDWGRIVAKAWLDSDFKDSLEKDPTDAIRKFMPEHKGAILELPPKPDDLEDGYLEDVVNGKASMHHCSNLC